MNNQKLPPINDAVFELCVGSSGYCICTKTIHTDNSKYFFGHFFNRNDHPTAIHRCEKENLMVMEMGKHRLHMLAHHGCFFKLQVARAVIIQFSSFLMIELVTRSNYKTGSFDRILGRSLTLAEI